MVKAVVEKVKKAATKVAVKKTPVKTVKAVKVTKVPVFEPKSCVVVAPDLSIPMGFAREALAIL